MGELLEKNGENEMKSWLPVFLRSPFGDGGGGGSDGDHGGLVVVGHEVLRVDFFLT